MRRVARTLGALVIGAGAVACAPRTLHPEQAPSPADRPLVAQGVEVRVLPNAWRGYPSWLPRRFTPLWLYFVNRGTESFDVTYAALQLVDENGDSHPAVPPTLVARELMGDRSGQLEPLLVPVQARGPGAVQGQSRQAQPPAEPPAASHPPRIPAPEPLPPASPPTPPTSTGSHLPDDTVYFGLAPYQYAAPFGGATAATATGRTPYGSGPAVSPFGTMSISRNAVDIVIPALREGRLLPNTHAEGFVYFRADASARRLELRLSARNERTGGQPLEISVPFTVR